MSLVWLVLWTPAAEGVYSLSALSVMQPWYFWGAKSVPKEEAAARQPARLFNLPTSKEESTIRINLPGHLLCFVANKPFHLARSKEHPVSLISRGRSATSPLADFYTASSWKGTLPSLMNLLQYILSNQKITKHACLSYLVHLSPSYVPLSISWKTGGGRFGSPRELLSDNVF